MAEPDNPEFTLVPGEFLASPVEESDRTTLLTKGHLGAIALAFPRWTLSIKSGVETVGRVFDEEIDGFADKSDMRVTKRFRRGLIDLHPRFRIGMDTGSGAFMEAYNRLGGDPEHSDPGLTKIFGVPYLDGNVDQSGYFVADVECDENDIPGLTILDAKKVAAAEAYLIEEELVRGRSSDGTVPPEDTPPIPSPLVPNLPTGSGSEAVEVPLDHVTN